MRLLSIRFVLLLGGALPLAAQTGQITGQVTDPSGARVPGASVTLTNLDTGVANSTVTNAEGYYTASFLMPGEYGVTASHSGFKTAARSLIKLDLGQIARINFSLVLGSQNEQVTVGASAAPLAQSEVAALGQVIVERTVVDLPLNGRNFTQLTTLTPGAYTGATTGFVRGSTVTANGMRTSNMVFASNGVNTTDQDFEGAANLPPPDAIREFKVQTNNLEAGRPMELEAVVGVVVELGERFGIPMPYTRTVYACTRLLGDKR